MRIELGRDTDTHNFGHFDLWTQPTKRMVIKILFHVHSKLNNIHLISSVNKTIKLNLVSSSFIVSSFVCSVNRRLDGEGGYKAEAPRV